MKSAIISRSFSPVSVPRLVRVHPMRAAFTWLAFHVFLAFTSGSVSAFGFQGAVIMAAAAAMIAFVDSRRRRETRFLGNLGIPKFTAPAIAAITVLVLEMLLAVLLSISGI